MANALQKHGEGPNRATTENATTGIVQKELAYNVAERDWSYRTLLDGYKRIPSYENLAEIGDGSYVEGASLIGVKDNSYTEFAGDTDLQSVIDGIHSALALVSGAEANLDAVLRDGSLPLTGNWGVGAYTLGYDNTGGLGFDASNNASFSDNLIVDTDVLFVNASLKRIGVNDATPSHTLDLKSNETTANGLYIEGTQTSGHTAYLYTNSIQTGNALRLYMDNAASTGEILWGNTDGSGALVKLNQAGSIKFEVSNSGEINGYSGLKFHTDNGIIRDVDTGVLGLSGGTSSSVGANILLYGSTHAGLAGDWSIRDGGTSIVWYDKSLGTISMNNRVNFNDNISLADNDKFYLGNGDNAYFQFNGADLECRPNSVGSGRFLVNGSIVSKDIESIMRDVDDDALIVSGGDASNDGARLILYGSAHLTNADDIIFGITGGTALKYHASEARLEVWNSLTTRGYYLKDEYSLGAGHITEGVSASNPDDISNDYSKIILAPTASTANYTLEGFEDDKILFLVNTSSGDGAVIWYNSISFTVPAYSCVMALYESGQDILFPCGAS